MTIQDDFHLAIQLSDAKKVQECLNNGAKVNQLDQQGYSVLARAIINKQKNIIKLLIQHQAKLFKKDFILSTYEDFIKLAEYNDGILLEKNPLLHIFAAYPNTLDMYQKTKLLLETNKVELDDLSLYFGHNLTPICVALIEENKKTVESFVRFGADVNFKLPKMAYYPYSTKTPFLLAAQLGDIDSMVYMAAKRKIPNVSEEKCVPNFNIVDESGNTVLHIAVSERRNNVFNRLFGKKFKNETISIINRRNSTGSTALHIAAADGEVEIVRELLKHGADPQLLDSYGRLALHLALSKINHHIPIEIVERLAVSSYFNKKDSFGKTPLMYAAHHGHMSACSLLFNLCREKFKDQMAEFLKMADYSGYTLAHYASVAGELALIEDSYSSDLNANENITPVHESACKDNIEAVKNAINNHNFNKDQSDYRGYTLLFAAAMCDSTNVIRYLVEIGASIEQRDKKGKTAIFHAVKKLSLLAFHLLLKNGANIASTDNHNRNILFGLVKKWSIETRNSETLDDRDNQWMDLFGFIITKPEIDLYHRDDNSFNLLFPAIEHSNCKVVNFLMERGVNSLVANKRGETPLSWAYKAWTIPWSYKPAGGLPKFNKDYHENANKIFNIFKKEYELYFGIEYLCGDYFSLKEILKTKKLTQDKKIKILQTLMQWKADPNAQLSITKETSIFYALQNDEFNVAQFLIDNGAELNIIDSYGKPPLFWDKLKRLPAIIKQPIDETFASLALPNLPYPLHYAVLENDREKVGFLIKLGVDLNSEDEQKRRPIDYAQGQEFTSMRTFLIDQGAIDSIDLNFELLKQVANNTKNPVIWINQLDMAYGCKTGKRKYVSIPASHSELKEFENSYRLSLEINEHKINSSITEEEMHNRVTEGLIADRFGNFLVVNLIFIISDSQHTKGGSHGRCCTKAIQMRIPPSAGKDNNFHHVTDSWADNSATFDARREAYIATAQDIYKGKIGQSIKLDQEFEFNDPQKKFHSEQALYEYLEENIERIIDEKLLGMVLENNKIIETGFKVYALVIDMHSTREMCGNCVDRTIGMQNRLDNITLKDGKSISTFKKKLHDKLIKKNLSHEGSQIRIVVRVSADAVSAGTHHVPSPEDPKSDTPVFVDEKNKESVESLYHYSVLFRKPLTIQQHQGTFLLASPPTYTRKNFFSREIGSVPSYTIFVSKKVPKKNEEHYKKIFSTHL